MKALKSNYILSLTTIWTNNGPYDIFYMVIYVTSINLTDNKNVSFYYYCRAIIFFVYEF